HQQDAQVQGPPYVHVRQVQALRGSIDLDDGPGAGGGLEDRLDVDLVGVAAAQPPARRVGQDVDPRVLEGGQDAAGHRRPVQVELAVDRGHDDVKLRQDVVGQIQAAVAADVDLDAGQEVWGAKLLPQPLNDLYLAAQAVGVEAVRHDDQRGMIGDRQVLVAGGGRRRVHLLDRGPAVAPAAVDMQLAPDVVRLDQGRQAPGAGGLELPGALPQFRRDPGQAQVRVDPGFVGRREPLPGSVPVHGEETVLVEFQPLVPGQAPQAHIVLLGAGKVLQRRAPGGRLDDPQIAVDPVDQANGGFRLAPGQHFRHGGRRAEGIEHLPGTG